MTLANNLLNNQLILTNLINPSTISYNSTNSNSPPISLIGDSPLDAPQDQVIYQLVKHGITNKEGQIVKDCPLSPSLGNDDIQFLSNLISQKIKTYKFDKEKTEKFIKKMRDSKFNFDHEQEALNTFLTLPFLTLDNQEIEYTLEIKNLLKHLVDENKHLRERSGLNVNSEDQIELISSSASDCLIHSQWTTRFFENICGTTIKDLVPEKRIEQIKKENSENIISIRYVSTLMNFQQMNELSREVVHQLALAIWNNNAALLAFDRNNFRLWKYFELFIQHTAFEEYSRNSQDNYDTLSLKQNVFRLDLTFMGTDYKQQPDALSISLNPFIYDHPQPIRIIPSSSHIAQSTIDLYTGRLQSKPTFQDFVQKLNESGVNIKSPLADLLTSILKADFEQHSVLFSFVEVLLFLRLNTSTPSSSNLQVYLTRNGDDLAIECEENFSFSKPCDLINSLQLLHTTNHEFDENWNQLFEILKPSEIFADGVQTPVQRHWNRFNVSSEDLIKEALNLGNHSSKLLKKLGYYLCLSSHFIYKNEMTSHFLITKFPQILSMIDQQEERVWLVRNFENVIFETHLKRGNGVLLQNPHLLKILSSKDLHSKEIKELCLLAWSETGCIKLESEAIQLYHQMPSSKKPELKKKQELKNRLTPFFLNFLARIHENEMEISSRELSKILVEIPPSTIPANRLPVTHNLAIRCLMQTMEANKNQDFVELQTRLSKYLPLHDHIYSIQFLRKLIQSHSFTEAIHYFSQIRIDEWTPHEKKELLNLLEDLLNHLTSDKNLAPEALRLLSEISVSILFKDVPQKKFSFLMRVLNLSPNSNLEIFPLLFTLLNRSLPSEEVVSMTTCLQGFLSSNVRLSKPFKEQLTQILPIILYHFDQRKCAEQWLDLLDIVQKHSISLEKSEECVKTIGSLTDLTLHNGNTSMRIHHRLNYLKLVNESSYDPFYAHLILQLLRQNHFHEANLWIERIYVSGREQIPLSAFLEEMTPLALQLSHKHIEAAFKLFSIYSNRYNSSWDAIFDKIIATDSKELKLRAWQIWVQQQSTLAEGNFSSSGLVGLKLMKSLVIDNGSEAFIFLKKRQSLFEYPAFNNETSQIKILLLLFFSVLKHMKNIPRDLLKETELLKVRSHIIALNENFDYSFLEGFTDVDLIQKYPLPMIDRTLIKAFCESDDVTVNFAGISLAYSFFKTAIPLFPHTDIAQKTFMDVIHVIIRHPSSDEIRANTLNLFGQLAGLSSFRSVDILPALKIYEKHFQNDENITMATIILIMSYWNSIDENPKEEHFGTDREQLSQIASKVCLYGLSVESFINQKAVYDFLFISKNLFPLDKWNVFMTKTILTCLRSAVKFKNASYSLLAVEFFIVHYDLILKIKSNYTDCIIAVFDNLLHLIDLDGDRKKFLTIFIHVLNLVSERKEPVHFLTNGIERSFSKCSEEDVLQDWQLICEQSSNPPNRNEYYSTLLFIIRVLSQKKISTVTIEYSLLFLHHLMSIFNNDDCQSTLDACKNNDLDKILFNFLYTPAAFYDPKLFHLHMEKCKLLFNHPNNLKRLPALRDTYINALLLFGDSTQLSDLSTNVLKTNLSLFITRLFTKDIPEIAHFLFQRFPLLTPSGAQFYDLFHPCIMLTRHSCFYLIDAANAPKLPSSSPGNYLYRSLLDMLLQFSEKIDDQNQNSYLGLLQVLCAHFHPGNSKQYMQKSGIKKPYWIIAQDFKIFFQLLIQEKKFTSLDFHKNGLMITLVDIISSAIEEIKGEEKLELFLKNLDLFEFISTENSNANKKLLELETIFLTEWIRIFENPKFSTTLKNYGKELHKKAKEVGFKIDTKIKRMR